jgi:type I restriction enzyme S subunit
MSFRRYRRYKASGVEWLGEVPEHWEVVRLKHAASLVTDRAEGRSNPVALENVEGWTGRLIPTSTVFEGDGIRFRRGDVLFGKLRPYLAKVFMADEAGEAVGDFHVLRPCNASHARFLQYTMLRREFIDIVDGSTFGSKMPRASWEALGAMPASLPPLPEQRAIAAFLDRETARIDALVAEQRRLIELLQEKRQAVISHAVTKGLDPTVRMKPSGVEWLGDIPAHWEVVPLRHLGCEIQTGPFGSQLHADEYIEGGIPVVNPINLQDGRIVLSEDVTVSVSTADRLAHHRLRLGDVVFARRGELGRCARVGRAEVGWICGTGSMILRLRGDGCAASYLEGFLSLPQTRSYFKVQSIGSVMPSLSTPTLLGLPVCVPPLPEQRAVAAFLDRATAKIDAVVADAESAISLLTERRSALISAAVTGQIDVRDAATVEAA